MHHSRQWMATKTKELLPENIAGWSP